MTETSTEPAETTEQPVPPKRPLFRPEAVEYHARSQTPNRTLDLHERRTLWVFRALLLTLAFAVLVAFTYQRPTRVTGRAVVDGSGTRVTVTVRDAARVDTVAEATVRVGDREVPALSGQPVPGRNDQVTYSLVYELPAGAEGAAVVSLEPRSIGSLLLGWD